MTTIREPMVTDDDTPRARASDPVTSHLAADKSQKGLSKLRVAVLRVFEAEADAGDGQDEITGSELNSLYAAYRVIEPGAFPRCHPDSPRKRSGELSEEGLLDVVGHRKGEFGSLESVYRLSPEGRAYLRSLS